MNRFVAAFGAATLLMGVVGGLGWEWDTHDVVLTGVGLPLLAVAVIRTAFPDTVTVRRQGVVDALSLEIERARRFDHEFALVRLRVDGPTYRRKLASELELHLRCIDQVAVDGHGVALVLAQTGRAGAQQLVGRLLEADVCKLTNQAEIAVYPSDGETAGALLAALQGRRLPNPVTASAEPARTPAAHNTTAA